MPTKTKTLEGAAGRFMPPGTGCQCFVVAPTLEDLREVTQALFNCKLNESRSGLAHIRLIGESKEKLSDVGLLEAFREVPESEPTPFPPTHEEVQARETLHAEWQRRVDAGEKFDVLHGGTWVGDETREPGFCGSKPYIFVPREEPEQPKPAPEWPPVGHEDVTSGLIQEGDVVRYSDGGTDPAIGLIGKSVEEWNSAGGMRSVARPIAKAERKPWVQPASWVEGGGL